MPTYYTPNRHGYSVRFSPFNPDRLAVATSQFYGLAGGGTLFLLELTEDDGIAETRVLQWTDGLFDVVWSEQDGNVLVSAAGDGSLQLWNVALQGCQTLPLCTYREHKKEVYSIDWSRTRHAQLMLSASWDCLIKLWDPNSSSSISTYNGHSQLVYNAMFSPLIPNTFASVSGDGYLKIWNTMGTQRAAMIVRAHDAEVLSCDWSKYEQYVVATGGSDGLIRLWDIRNINNHVHELRGCEFAVRKVQFSPFAATTIASVSYDSTTRIWDYQQKTDALEIIRHHSEFTYGLDWNVLRKNQLADCGWDSLVHVFTPQCLRADAS